MAVVVEQTVETYGVACGHKAAAVHFGAQRAAGADADEIQPPVVGQYGAGGEVEVGGSVQLGDHDVDVVAAHTGGECCESGAVIASREGMQFAVVRLVLNAVEDFFEHIDPIGVAHQKHIVGEGVAGKMNVVKAPVGSQYQFAFFYCHC